MATSREQNSIHNISKAIEALEREKWVIAIEVGAHESNLIQSVINSCEEKVMELNAKDQIDMLGS